MQVKKNRILYVGGFELPDKNAASHRVLNNARILRELGYDVIFCGITKEESKKEATNEKIDGFCNYPINYPKTTGQWVRNMLSFKEYKEHLGKDSGVRIVIAYNMHAVPLFHLYRYCKANGIKLIIDCTEWYDNNFSMNPVKAIKWLDTNIAMRYMQKKCDGMIVISEYLKKYYKKSVDNLVVVPPLVNVDEEKWHQFNTSEKDTDVIEFVYTGIPGTTKDQLDKVIEGFSKIKDGKFKLTVIGITEQEFLKQYPQLNSTVRTLQGEVAFLGKRTHLECIKALIDSDCSIFVREQSRKNNAGFPTKFVESYTSGADIIANSISDIKNYFPQGNSILIETCSAEDICAAIAEICKKDPETLRQERRNGLLDNPFDYRNWVQVFSEFLHNIE